MAAEILRWVLIVLGGAMVGGTLLSLSTRPHWFIRGWDFPRLQIMALALLAAVPYAVFFRGGRWYDWVFLAAIAGCLLYQGWRVLPYTRLGRTPVKRAGSPPRGDPFRLMTCNVLMENEQYDRWLEIVKETDPDIILALEINDRWCERILHLERDYPHVVCQSQENCYGMLLLSRLKLIEPQLRFIVQDDIPSIHTSVELPCGDRIYLSCLHPKPPEPLRDQDSTPRDAELVVVGREIADEEERSGRGATRPTIVMGDLNDVAWSHSSRLFQRISRLLDPRMGRGLYNTWNAQSRVLRFPLDHVFHSDQFKLIDLRVMRDIGSDHFPVVIDLSYEPAAEAVQPKPEKEAEDEEEAQRRVDLQEEEMDERINSSERT